MPESELRHYINDDELDRLGEMTRDIVREIFWASIGGLLGSVTGGLQALGKLNDTAHPIGGTDLLNILIFAVCLAVGVLCLVLMRQKSSGRTQLLTQIRGRQRVRVVPQPVG